MRVSIDSLAVIAVVSLFSVVATILFWLDGRRAKRRQGRRSVWSVALLVLSMTANLLVALCAAFLILLSRAVMTGM